MNTRAGTCEQCKHSRFGEQPPHFTELHLMCTFNPPQSHVVPIQVAAGIGIQAFSLFPHVERGNSCARFELDPGAQAS